MIFSWDKAKNHFIKKNRNIGFERIIVAIEEGDILDVLKHPDITKYHNQKIYMINIDSYAWVVPFRDEAGKRILITAYPSRKYTSLYTRRMKNEILR